MKKSLIILCLLALHCNLYAESELTEGNVGATIVISPCDKVPNTLLKGKATDEEIKKAYDRMLEECNK